MTRDLTAEMPATVPSENQKVTIWHRDVDRVRFPIDTGGDQFLLDAVRDWHWNGFKNVDDTKTVGDIVKWSGHEPREMMEFLEQVWRIYNRVTGNEPMPAIRSMITGDLINVDSKFYLARSFGWVRMDNEVMTKGI